MDEVKVIELQTTVKKLKDQIKIKTDCHFQTGGAFALGSSLGGMVVASSSTLVSLELT